jgi:hypothetical protein
MILEKSQEAISEKHPRSFPQRHFEPVFHTGLPHLKKTPPYRRDH